MLMQSRFPTGAQPNFAVAPMPLQARTGSYQVSPWPMMQNASFLGGATGAGLGITPRFVAGANTTDRSDEAASIHVGQYTVINETFAPNIAITSASLLFTTDYPNPEQMSQCWFPQDMSSITDATTPKAIIFTLATVNRYLREQYAKTRLIWTLTRGARGVPEQILVSALYSDADRQRKPWLPASGLTLSEEEKVLAHYAFPSGVMKRLRFLGPSTSQPNELFGGDDKQLTSITAKCNLTRAVATFRGSASVRNYWGKEALKFGAHLWLLVKINKEDGDETMEMIPYCSGLSSVVPRSELVYTHPLTKREELARKIYVGRVAMAVDARNVDSKEILKTAAGRSRSKTSDHDIVMAEEQLGLISIDSRPPVGGSYMTMQ